MTTLGIRPSRRPMLASDQQLVEAVATGDPAAGEAIRARYGPAARIQVQRLLGPAAPSDDIAEAVFRRLRTAAGGFDPDRASLGAFLLTIATGTALEWVRAEAARRSYADSRGRPRLGGTDLHEIGWAIETLPLPEGQAVWLASSAGFNYRQIALALGVGEDAAKANLRSGLRRLRALIGLDEQGSGQGARRGGGPTELGAPVSRPDLTAADARAQPPP